MNVLGDGCLIISLHTATDENMEPQVMASELHNVRLKLEEKRRRIENDKRKMEQAMNKLRQKLGKEAFMQAVVKGVSDGQSEGTSFVTNKFNIFNTNASCPIFVSYILIIL